MATIKKYYGWDKYSHQKTRTYIEGSFMGGHAIEVLPAAALKAGTILVNIADSSNSNKYTVTSAKRTDSGNDVYDLQAAIEALGITATVTPSSGTASATVDASNVSLAGKLFMLAEDCPATPDKIVCYELTENDIDNLKERKAPKTVVDSDGKDLYI